MMKNYSTTNHMFSFNKHINNLILFWQFDRFLDCRFPQHTISVQMLIVILSSIIFSFEKGICRPFLYISVYNDPFNYSFLLRWTNQNPFCNWKFHEPMSYNIKDERGIRWTSSNGSSMPQSCFTSTLLGSCLFQFLFYLERLMNLSSVNP